MVVFPNVIIDFMFKICTLFTKNTNIPTLNFATIFTEVTSVLWFVWLHESSQSVSLCKHVLFC